MNRQNRGLDALRVDSTSINDTPERISMSPSFSLASVPSVAPEPAYIAAAAAANVVAGEIAHEFHVELSDGAFVSPGSLNLINTFLDRLLFNFLSCAHSTSLGALRPAVTEVLKPRLAKEAIAGADEELEEYLGGDSDEMDLINGEKGAGPWDLDVAWKRTRLRCMLYTRLGDMEEEEEELFLEQDNIQEGGGQHGSHIQPAVAIFLTSVLEFIGEHALMIAAQAAYKRHETRSQLENMGFRKIMVEEVDMEKNAVNSTLGRLWRIWRASIRSPRASISRSVGAGPRGFRGFSVSSRSSMTTESHLQEGPEEEIGKIPTVKEKVVEIPDPSKIALPTTTYDIDEIEVPGFSTELAQRRRNDRSESMLIHPGSHTYGEDLKDDTFEHVTPTASLHYQRTRSSSLPNSETPAFIYQAYTPSDNSFTTPLEGSPQPEELRAQSTSIIDMSGNSVAVIKDYAIPKSNSAPTSPHAGSMLNAISASAAQGLTGQSFYHEDDYPEQDPTDGALQFDRNDYEVGEHEHSNRGSRVSTIEPIRTLQAPFEYPMAVSPLVGPIDHPVSGAVSPLDSEFPPHQISPSSNEIDHDEDASDISNKSVRAVKIPTSLSTAGSIAAITSPKIAAVSMGTIANARAIPKVEEQGTILARANQGRQRLKEGPTSQDYTKEENRGAFVLPEELDSSKQTERISKPEEVSISDTDSRRWRPVEKGIVTTNLPPVRESVENKAITPEQTSPSKQYPVSRKAVPPVTSPVSPQRQVSKISTDVDQVTGQRMVTTPISAKESHSAPRITDSNIRSANSVKSTVVKNKSRGASFTNDSIPSRTSTEGLKNSGHDRFSRSSTSNSDSHRDFDHLINSGETLQYTLTSQSMREIEERGKEPGQKAPSPIQLRSRTLSTDRNKAIPLPTTTPSPQSMNGLRSNPTTDLTPVPFVVHAGSSAKRGPPLIAKDARMERANTSDLKDFFRSTGPESGTSESVQRQQTITSPSKSNSTRSIPKYEPREATRSQDNDTAMLAEFLRQGPPGAQRVPARLGVDDLGGRFRDAPSVASTQDSFVSRSIQSSTNSRVGLLDSTRAYNNKSSTAPWEKRGPQHTDDTGLPARKQRRVRDPYAIDGDSEDDPDTGTPRGAQSQGNEESLIDFLRNAEPPSSETKTLSPPLSPSSSASPAGKGYQKKSSSGKALKSRFGSTNRKPNPTRTVSTPTSIYKPNTSNYSDFQSNSYANLRQPQQQQQQPPSQSNRTYAKENFNGTVSRINGNGVRQARKLARDGREDSTSVRDLAEFLRNTEPPPSSSDSLPPLPPLPIQDDISGGSGGGGGGGSGFTRMFSRRKKGVAA